MNKTILITGGAGYIGSACVKALCDAGYTVVVVDNLSTGKRSYVDARAIFIQADILDPDTLLSIFEQYAPYGVIHCAARKAVGESETQPAEYFKTNVTGTLNVLTCASKTGVTHILFSSTAAVYCPTTEGIYDETCAVESQSVYGTSKIIAEALIQDFSRVGAIPHYTIFRYFNVAGDAGLSFEEKEAQNLIPALLRSISTKEPLSIFGGDYETEDGTCIRDYVHLSDIVRAHILALETGRSGVFNLGTSTGTSVLGMIAAFERATGRAVPYQIVERRPGDVMYVRAQAEKAKRELGWEPQYSLDDIMRSLVSFIKP